MNVVPYLLMDFSHLVVFDDADVGRTLAGFGRGKPLSSRSDAI